jgi:hypothetical protein
MFVIIPPAKILVQLAARNWIDQIASGLSSLLADPKRQLDVLAAFLGEEYIDEDWPAPCAATVRKPRSTWRHLSDDDANALSQVCRPGFERLPELGFEYDF